MFMEGNMADDSKLLTISEEGCLRWNSRIRNVVYHKSLNVLIGFCPDGNDDGQIVVIDIASRTILGMIAVILTPVIVGLFVVFLILNCHFQRNHLHKFTGCWSSKKLNYSMPSEQATVSRSS